MNLNILSSIPASRMSIRMPCLHVKCYDFSISKKMDTICSLFAWAFLAVASGHKRWSIVVHLALPERCSVTVFPSVQRSPTVLHLPFSG